MRSNRPFQKQKGFDNYFSIDETQFVSIKSFEELFKSNNKIVILIDALDEIESKLRIKLIEKLNLLYQKYKNVKLIFTTRNKTDAVTINNSFSLETKVYELRGLELLDIERLYDNLSSKYIVK